MTWLPERWSPPASACSFKGFRRSDRMRPDDLSLMPWQAGKPLTGDVTVVCPLNDSYVAKAAREAGSVGLADLAVDRKSAKYRLGYSLFFAIAIETFGPINDSAREFLFNLGRKISLQSGHDREQLFVSANLYSDSVI